jgi:hypothetical protein
MPTGGGEQEITYRHANETADRNAAVHGQRPVSDASPGGVGCRTGDNGFLWSSWGGIIGGIS